MRSGFFLEKKDVRALHVSVQDLTAVEGAQATDNLDEDIPDLFLLDVGLTLLVVTDFLEDIAIVSVLHYKTMYTKNLLANVGTKYLP